MKAFKIINWIFILILVVAVAVGFSNEFAGTGAIAVFTIIAISFFILAVIIPVAKKIYFNARHIVENWDEIKKEVKSELSTTKEMFRKNKKDRKKFIEKHGKKAKVLQWIMTLQLVCLGYSLLRLFIDGVILKSYIQSENGSIFVEALKSIDVLTAFVFGFIGIFISGAIHVFWEKQYRTAIIISSMCFFCGGITMLMVSDAAFKNINIFSPWVYIIIAIGAVGMLASTVLFDLIKKHNKDNNISLRRSFRKGTHILIKFRDGSQIDCKFLECKEKSMLTDKGEFLYKKMLETKISKSEPKQTK